MQNPHFAVAKQWFLTYGSMRTKILCGNLGPRAYIYIYIHIIIYIYMIYIVIYNHIYIYIYIYIYDMRHLCEDLKLPLAPIWDLVILPLDVEILIVRRTTWTMIRWDWQCLAQDVYPLVNIQKAMENHHFSWENSLFLWPCSIVFCMFTRG